ncbi:MAG: hypothetical protein KDA66_19350, partial [Planctomycetaceae bacterium]|nr:hypothetical protein [Planctomycetaceae bacterium]
DTPEMWRERTPEVVVQDIAWKAGEKLQDYEIQGAGKPVDANLVCDVKLTLQNSDGDLHEELVTYLVGTSPVLTVFRQVQP